MTAALTATALLMLSTAAADLPGDGPDPFRIAYRALENRAQDLEGHALEAVLTERAQLEYAERLIELVSVGGLDPLVRGVALAKADVPAGLEPVTGLVDALPSELALQLVDLLGAQAAPDEVSRLRSLDEVPSPAREALASLFAGFLDLSVVAQSSFAGLDPAVTIAPTLHDLRIDAAELAAARGRVLDGMVALDEALRSLGVSPSGVQTVAMDPPVQIPGVLSVDLERNSENNELSCEALGANDVYAQDFALLIDRCGDDTYLNNAGGSGTDGGACTTATPRAAALLDLRGNDRYTSGRSCGANGGGFFGVGMLVDKGGSDVYSAGSSGTNGGGHLGMGLLVDVPLEAELKVRIFPFIKIELTTSFVSDDSYVGGSMGVNGGGFLAGIGTLVDLVGTDLYQAGGFGANGGGSTGSGRLIDGSGADLYNGTSEGVNGGGFIGTGFLLDMGGNDQYLANVTATNGGGRAAGVGLLVDLDGQDVYQAGGLGSNGGGVEFSAVGMLLDLAGSDAYTGGSVAVNGAGLGASGHLIDLRGNDSYVGSLFANGAARSLITGGDAHGLLLDTGGTDQYNDGTVAGTGTDLTQIPKGQIGGAQIDLALLT